MRLIDLELEDLERHWSFLGTRTNPVIRKASVLEASTLVSILSQYGQFPREIVRVFSRALTGLDRIKHACVVQELVSNIQEELGVYGSEQEEHTRMIAGPHYLVLRAEIQAWLGLDLNALRIYKVTASFLDEIETTVSTPNSAVVCGALLALEASAIGELRVVREIARRVETGTGRPMSDKLVRFFEYHANVVEVGHRDRLLQSIVASFTTPEEYEACSAGMTSVLTAMQHWWDALAQVNDETVGGH